jgi:hypothetical protein
MPLAPVAGTMWAASPARNSRPCRIGSTTKLRMALTPLAGCRFPSDVIVLAVRWY